MVREIAGELAGRAVVVQVNTQENNRVAARLGVRGIPVVFLLKDGKVLAQLAGKQTKSALLALVAGHVNN